MAATAEDGGSLPMVMGFQVEGGTPSTNKTASGMEGLVEFLVREHDGSNAFAASTSNSNLFTIRTIRTGDGTTISTVFGIDEDGQGHLVTDTLVVLGDAEDDAEIVRSYDHTMADQGRATGLVGSRWDSKIRYSEDDLVRLGVLGAPLAEGGMWCFSRHIHLNSSAIWQKHEEIMDIISVLNPTQREELALRNPRIKARLALQGA
jgi:hypothetical protein